MLVYRNIKVGMQMVYKFAYIFGVKDKVSNYIFNVLKLRHYVCLINVTKPRTGIQSIKEI